MIRRLLITLLILSCAGCSSLVPLNNADRLVTRPDFRAATQSAPEWVRDALKTINRLEHQLERK